MRTRPRITFRNPTAKKTKEGDGKKKNSLTTTMDKAEKKAGKTKKASGEGAPTYQEQETYASDEGAEMEQVPTSNTSQYLMMGVAFAAICGGVWFFAGRSS